MRVSVLAFASLLIATPVLADPALAESRLADLTQMTELLEGFTPRADHWAGALAVDEDLWAEATFAVGNEYVVLLTSDTLVHGIVVEIVDGADTVVARSEPAGAEVLCRFAPAVTGTYQIHIVRPIPVGEPDEDGSSDPPEGSGTAPDGSAEAAPDPVERAHFAARLAYR